MSHVKTVGDVALSKHPLETLVAVSFTKVQATHSKGCKNLGWDVLNHGAFAIEERPLLDQLAGMSWVRFQVLSLRLGVGLGGDLPVGVPVRPVGVPVQLVLNSRGEGCQLDPTSGASGLVVLPRFLAKCLGLSQGQGSSSVPGGPVFEVDSGLLCRGDKFPSPRWQGQKCRRWGL